MNNKNADDLNNVLFLIGIQELGQGKRSYSREEKQDLIHIGICACLSVKDFYTLDYKDEEGWPHYKMLKKSPHGKVGEQELFLKENVIAYFKHHELIEL